MVALIFGKRWPLLHDRGYPGHEVLVTQHSAEGCQFWTVIASGLGYGCQPVADRVPLAMLAIG